jgi:hypothetical protein
MKTRVVGNAHPTIESIVIVRCAISIFCAPIPLLPTWEKGLGDEGYFKETLVDLSNLEVDQIIDL